MVTRWGILHEKIRTHIAIIYVVRVAHQLHHVAETARKSIPDVDTWVFGMNNLFKKSPRRTQKFREICLDLPLPPEPVSTRWTTWLNGVHPLNNHYEQMLRQPSTFKPDGMAVMQSLTKDNIAKMLFCSCNSDLRSFCLQGIPKVNM